MTPEQSGGGTVRHSDDDANVHLSTGFKVGDRVCFPAPGAIRLLDRGSDGLPQQKGTIKEVVRGRAVGYRIAWDDDYVDDPGAPLYMHFELQSEIAGMSDAIRPDFEECGNCGADDHRPEWCRA